jgi:hypothetical protein
MRQSPTHLPWPVLSAMVTAGASCVACGSREDLVAHHKMPRRYGGAGVASSQAPAAPPHPPLLAPTLSLG